MSICAIKTTLIVLKILMVVVDSLERSDGVIWLFCR